MKPEDFRTRFVSALPSVPVELNLKLDEFHQFPTELLSDFDITKEDKLFLSRVGFPKSASPFLSFTSYSDLSDLPPGHFPIGADGSGNNLCVEVESGNIILLDHDFDMNRVFINSSLRQFAECICLYQEHFTAKSMNDCFRKMCDVDQSLRGNGHWWQNEVENA